MTLLQKIKAELENRGLSISNIKEYNEKYKVTLIDIETGFTYKNYNIYKSIQPNAYKHFAEMTRSLMDMHIQLLNENK